MLDSVFITGGSRGIGEAAVRRFAAMGKRVAFTYMNSKERALNISFETGAHAFFADAGDAASLQSSVTEAKAAIGSIDILVNNAGVSIIKPLMDIDPAEWDSMLRINASSMYITTRAVLSDMIKANCGRIISVSSVWGMYGASCETHYSASKAAVIGFTKALSKELAYTEITVNCIAPGAIDTDMNAGFTRAELNDIINEIPARRLGSPEEVAALICFWPPARLNV